MNSYQGIFFGAYLYIVLLLSEAEVRAASCTDIDSVACDLFSKEEDICFSSCLSTLCPRRCGGCPLECFECLSVSSPELCKTTTLCPDKNHSCIVTDSLDSTFHKSYRLGCAAPDVCSQVSGSHAGIIIGRQLLTGPVGTCCQRDLCNNLTSSSSSSFADIPASVKRASPPTPDCRDISPTACQQLSNVMSDMCSNPCIASKCRQSCGQCMACFACEHVRRPEDCTNTTSCQTGEECYVLETVNGVGEHGYRLGCMTSTACGQFYTQAGNIFGKRDNLELAIHGDCCKGDLCNHYDIRPTTSGSSGSPGPSGTPQMTPDPDCVYNGHCPDDYGYTDGKCLLIHDDRFNHNDAREICKDRCGRLAEDLDADNVRDIANYVNANYDSPRPHFFYVGIEREDDGHLVWETSRQPVYTGKYSDYDHECGTIDINNPGKIHPVRCQYEYHPICEAPAK